MFTVNQSPSFWSLVGPESVPRLSGLATRHLDSSAKFNASALRRLSEEFERGDDNTVITIYSVVSLLEDITIVDQLIEPFLNDILSEARCLPRAVTSVVVSLNDEGLQDGPACPDTKINIGSIDAIVEGVGK
ncbi:hypothetical protein FSARC_12542 [Fusarium sarcochroum]|uniref:Uncharacterized protein n=1 Tax=Fusarium sarcochroum TaxID=1208366 RepID=A0A8H4WX16_9HYPO|nr:hypothetical protein FSARC_12542 [Fusarium sarcochroum]